MKIGFIGTGLMGVPMIKNLLKSKNKISIFNRTIKKAVAYRFFCGSVNEVSIKDKIIKIWTNKSQLRLWPNFLNTGRLNLSIIGDQRYLKAYAKPAQLKRVIVLLSTPALDNQTDKVENTNNIGNPEEKPNKSIFNDFSLKK